MKEGNWNRVYMNILDKDFTRYRFLYNKIVWHYLHSMKSDYNIVFQPFLGKKESLKKIVVKHDGVLTYPQHRIRYAQVPTQVTLVPAEYSQPVKLPKLAHPICKMHVQITVGRRDSAAFLCQ